jgi:hypothetical protein
MEIKNVTTGSLDLQMSSVSAVPEPSAAVTWAIGSLAAIVSPRLRRRR